MNKVKELNSVKVFEIIKSLKQDDVLLDLEEYLDYRTYWKTIECNDIEAEYTYTTVIKY